MNTVRIKGAIDLSMRCMRLNKAQTIELGLLPLWVVICVISIRAIAIFIGRIQDDFVIQQVSMDGNDFFDHVTWNGKQNYLAICQCLFRRTNEDLTSKFLTQALCSLSSWIGDAESNGMSSLDPFATECPSNLSCS